jgi:hypothetical protein
MPEKIVYALSKNKNWIWNLISIFPLSLVFFFFR